MPGRPKGSKNRAGHNAGGARPGAGRKRKDGQEAPLSVTETAMKALRRALVRLSCQGFAPTHRTGLTGQNFHDVGSLEVTGNDGVTITVDITGLVPKKPDGTLSRSIPTGTAKLHTFSRPAKAADEDEDTLAIKQEASISELESNEPRGVVVPENGQVSEPDMQELIKLFNNSSDPAATARLSLILNPQISHKAIQAALAEGASIPEALLPLEDHKPSLVTGPFMVMPVLNEDGTPGNPATDTPPTLSGPMDSSFLPPQHCTAVYYVVYEKRVPVYGYQQPSKPKSSGPRTGPGVPVAGPSLQALRSGEVLSAPWGNVDLTDRKRAPRRCVICGAYECKGRGGRMYCPDYDPNNIDHTTIGTGGRKRKKEEELEVPSFAPEDSAALNDFLPPEYANYGVHPSLIAELQDRQKSAGLDDEDDEPAGKRARTTDEESEDVEEVQIDPTLE